MRNTFLLSAALPVTVASWLTAGPITFSNQCGFLEFCPNGAGHAEHARFCKEECNLPDTGCPAPHDCCTPGGCGTGASPFDSCVCAFDHYCCETEWDRQCIEEAQEPHCGLTCGGSLAKERGVLGDENANVMVANERGGTRRESAKCLNRDYLMKVDTYQNPESGQGDQPVDVDVAAVHMAISGGGWRAMSSAMGVSRALHQLGHLSKIPTFSSVSGGTWHLAQLAMSPRYGAAVMGGNDTEFEASVTAWYAAYSTLIPADYQSNSNLEETVEWYMGKESPYTEIIKLVAYFDYSWEKFVTAMLDGFDTLEGVHKRTGPLKDATLVINMAFPFSAALSDATVYHLSKPALTNMQPENRLLPASHVIPAGTKDRFWLLSGRNAGKVQYQTYSFTEGTIHHDFELDDNVTIHKPVAASSAAAGILACVDLLSQLIYFPGTVTKEFPELAVRIGDTQFIDGAYVENTGTAAGIAYVQKGGGQATTASNPLRFLVLDNSLAGDCQASIPWLFLTTDEQMTPQLKQLDARVFKENWSDIKPQLKEIEVAGFRGSGPKPKWARLTVETVDNELFGVKRGWAVELFVVLMNSDLATIHSGEEDQQPYIDGALNMQAATTALQAELAAFF